MFRKINFAGLLFFLLYGNINAQLKPEVVISKNDLKNAVLNQNQQLQSVQLAEKIADSRFKETQAVFLPQVGLSYTGLVTNNPLNAFGFRLQQSIVKAQDFDPAKLNNPGNTTDFMTRIELRQPIINLEFWQQRKAAKGMRDVAMLQSKRAKEEMIYEAEKTYAQLQFLHEADKVVKQALVTADEVLMFTTNRFKQGLLQESDVLNTEVFKTKVLTQMAEIESAMTNASAYLNWLMGRSDTISYKPSEQLEAGLISISNTSNLDNRSDIAAMKAGLIANEHMLKSIQQSRLPKLNAFAQYQWNNNAAFTYRENSYLTGFHLSWNIFSGNSTNTKLNSEKLVYAKMQQDLKVYTTQQELHLSNALNNLKEAEAKIVQTKMSARQAEEAFRILNNRYQQGLVNNTDLLMMQTQMNEQKLAYQEALLYHQIIQLNIQFLNPAK